MSTVAIDSSRTSERLSAFMSHLENSEPVDNYFVRRPALDAFLKGKKMQDGGRQIWITVDTDENPTIQDFSDYDVFDTSGSDTAVSAVYPMVNKGGTIVISWEELREIAGKDHQAIDLLSHKRRNAMKTMMDKLATDLFASSAVTGKITPLPILIDSSGSVGSISASTETNWAATETASGSFAAQGLSDMRTLYNTLCNNGADPDMILTTQSIYEFYENEVDPDVRYAAAMAVGGRGFKSLEFKGIPLIHDLKATSGVLYMVNTENTYFKVDTMGNFSVDPFVQPANQKAQIAKLVFRGNLICDRRKSNGKLTGITA